MGCNIVPLVELYEFDKVGGLDAHSRTTNGRVNGSSSAQASVFVLI